MPLPHCIETGYYNLPSDYNMECLTKSVSRLTVDVITARVKLGFKPTSCHNSVGYYYFSSLHITTVIMLTDFANEFIHFVPSIPILYQVFEKNIIYFFIFF